MSFRDEQLEERRTQMLGELKDCRDIEEKAADEGRGLTADEQSRIDDVAARSKTVLDALAQRRHDSAVWEVARELSDSVTGGIGGVAGGRKAVGGLGRSAPKWSPPSPLHAAPGELEKLYDAACHRAGGFQIQIGGTKAGAEFGVKAAGAPIFAGGLGLPAVLHPELQLALPYETDRLLDHFLGATMDGPSAAFLSHVGNTNPAQATAEGAPKVDLGMQLTEQIVKPVKIAALASATMEALQDYESFTNWIPLELTRALINAETAEVVSGSGTAPHMQGILNTSGVLAHPIGSDTPIDALQMAFNDLRVGPAYATADLVALHPTTWSAIRREKTTLGNYILAPDPSTGQVESIFGVSVVVNTMVPAGTGIVFDTQQAVLAWTRMGLTLGVNQFGDAEWVNNTVSFRAEERIAIGVRRPTAVCVVTGLPTS